MSVVSSANKTVRHDIAEILFKVALSTITLTLSEYQFSNINKTTHLPNQKTVPIIVYYYVSSIIS